MLALLPVFAVQWRYGVLPVHKLRTWAAMFCASLAAAWVAPLCGVPLIAYIVIDVTAGVAVIARPSGMAQRAIGFLFAAMVLFHTGYAMSIFMGNEGLQGYQEFQVIAGWVQLAILAAWGIYDAGKRVGNRHWPRRNMVAVGPDIEGDR